MGLISNLLWKTCLLTGRRSPGRSSFPAGLPVEPKAMEPRRCPSQRYPCGRVADKGGDRGRATRDQGSEAADSAFGRGKRPEQRRLRNAAAGQKISSQNRPTRRSSLTSARTSPSGSPVSSAAARSASYSRVRERPSWTSAMSVGAKIRSTTTGQGTWTMPAITSGRLRSSRNCPSELANDTRRDITSASPMIHRSRWAICPISCARTRRVLGRRGSRTARR